VRGTLPRFVVAALLWLPVTFAVWYIAAPLILWPVHLLAGAVLKGGFADLIAAVDSQGSILQAVTRLRPGQATAGGSVSVDVNMLLYAYGLPMLAALVLAAREPGWPRKLAIGYLAMVPFMAWGVVADVLKGIALGAGAAVASQTGFSAAQREVIAFAYQFGTLILPTVVPAAAWVLTHRTFLERLRQA